MPELADATKQDAIKELQAAIRALATDDYATFSHKLGNATKAVNSDIDAPYYLGDAGGPPVVEVGPSIMLPDGHSLSVTLPDVIQPNEPEYTFAINLNDHLHLLVDGERKGTPTVTVQSDEFPTHVQLNDIEGSFQPVTHYSQ